MNPHFILGATLVADHLIKMVEDFVYVFLKSNYGPCFLNELKVLSILPSYIYQINQKIALMGEAYICLTKLQRVGIRSSDVTTEYCY